MEINPKAEKVLRQLEAAGFETWVVGGAVRDNADERYAGDWDFTTAARPEEILAVFSAYNCIETGKRHGTITVCLEDETFEITTFRRESGYADRRHPDAVAFTEDVREDLSRRDFTVNAMAWHPERGLLDLFDGERDRDNKLLCCVGDPRLRFEEDPLRILRGLRFASKSGMIIEADTAAAMFEKRRLLETVAWERIYAELCGLLCGRNVFPVLMQYRDVLAVPLPELEPTFDFDQRNPHHSYDVYEHICRVVAAVQPEPTLRWAALFHDVGKPACFRLDEKGVGHFSGHAEAGAAIADAVLHRLRTEKARRERIDLLIRNHYGFGTFSEAVLRRTYLKFGTELPLMLLELMKADAKGKNTAYSNRIAELEAAADLLRSLQAKAPPLTRHDLTITGLDLQTLGFSGAEIAGTLSVLLEEVALKGLPNTREALSERACALKGKLPASLPEPVFNFKAQ